MKTLAESIIVIATLAILFALINVGLDRVEAASCATHEHYLTTMPDYYLTNPQFDQCIKLMDLAEDDFETIDAQGRMYLSNLTAH